MKTYYASVGVENPLGVGHFEIKAYNRFSAVDVATKHIPTGYYLYDIEPDTICHKELKEITIIAIDIETDGLEHKGGQILEICMHRLDANLNIIDSFEGVLPFNTESFDDFIMDMHTKSGLVYEESTIIPSDVTDWLDQYENIVWLGSSVGFDACWMREHFPCKTSHRMIDTSSFVMLLDLTNRLEAAESKHRASDDIAYSISVARLYRDALTLTTLL